jgi:hypothetical protein
VALELDGKRCAYGDCRSVRTVRCNECSHRREHDECWHLHFADIGEVAIAVVGQCSGMSLDGCGPRPPEQDVGLGHECPRIRSGSYWPVPKLRSLGATIRGPG